jgi:aspartyl-tRNA(Asn)/glutamyl-tRNA(Gln) amidotransferase subunit C
MAVTTDDVKKLANLARLELTDSEVEKLRGEIDSILAYIDTIQKVTLPDGIAASPHLDLKNVMRDDGTPHESGQYTKDLVDQFPDSENGYLKVKKILG